MIQKLSAIANATLYKVTMEELHLSDSSSFLTMCKILFHLNLLTSIQEACISLFWEAWVWENTQIQVLNPKPIAPCWESFSDHFWQYQRLLTSSVSVCRVIWSALALLHSLLWLPILCTFYGWVLHKLLTLLTLCLMNLWDPMIPRLILDVRRYRIWRHQERTMTHQHCTINALGVTSACKVDWLRSQPLSLRSHRSQGWGRQWGWVPLLRCLLYGKLFQICLASVFLSAQ